MTEENLSCHLYKPTTKDGQEQCSVVKIKSQLNNGITV